MNFYLLMVFYVFFCFGAGEFAALLKNLDKEDWKYNVVYQFCVYVCLTGTVICAFLSGRFL